MEIETEIKTLRRLAEQPNYQGESFINGQSQVAKRALILIDKLLAEIEELNSKLLEIEEEKLHHEG